MRATAAGATAPFKERTERCMTSSLPRRGCCPGTCTSSATGRAMAIAESGRRTCWRAPCGGSQVLVEGKRLAPYVGECSNRRLDFRPAHRARKCETCILDPFPEDERLGLGEQDIFELAFVR